MILPEVLYIRVRSGILQRVRHLYSAGTLKECWLGALPILPYKLVEKAMNHPLQEPQLN